MLPCSMFSNFKVLYLWNETKYLKSKVHIESYKVSLQKELEIFQAEQIFSNRPKLEISRQTKPTSKET